MTMLNGEPIYPGCLVYDWNYGPGTVSAVECDGKIHVSFGSAGRPRQYNSNGLTGKLCNRTLFHVPPAIIEFSRDECATLKKKIALEGVLAIFDDMSKVECCAESGCEPAKNCCN